MILADDYIEAATVDNEKVSGPGPEMQAKIDAAKESLSLSMMRKAVIHVENTGTLKEWTVTLNKEEGVKMGVELVQGDNQNHLAVKGIMDAGAVQRWNESNLDDAIEVDDVIVQVNNVFGTAKDLMAEIKTANPVALKMERHSARLHFTIELKKKEGEKIGLTLEPGHQGHLRILDIGEGAVKNYNASSSTPRAVDIGDYILQVNGSGKEMSSKLAKEESLTIAILRTD
jgi:hypothetical protein